MASGKTRFNSEIVTGDVLSAPLQVLDPALANSAGVGVGRGKLLRIRVAATTYLKFVPAGTSFATPTNNTDQTLELFTAGTYLVHSTDDLMFSSAAIARLEVL